MPPAFLCRTSGEAGSTRLESICHRVEGKVPGKFLVLMLVQPPTSSNLP